MPHKDEVVIQWVDDLPAKRGGPGSSKWDGIAEAVAERKDPKRWARFGPYTRSAAGSGQSRIRDRHPHVRAKVRQVDGKHYLFVRYVGAASTNGVKR